MVGSVPSSVDPAKPQSTEQNNQETATLKTQSQIPDKDEQVVLLSDPKSTRAVSKTDAWKEVTNKETFLQFIENKYDYLEKKAMLAITIKKHFSILPMMACCGMTIFAFSVMRYGSEDYLLNAIEAKKKDQPIKFTKRNLLTRILAGVSLIFLVPVVLITAVLTLASLPASIPASKLYEVIKKSESQQAICRFVFIMPLPEMVKKIAPNVSPEYWQWVAKAFEESINNNNVSNENIISMATKDAAVDGSTLKNIEGKELDQVLIEIIETKLKDIIKSLPSDENNAFEKTIFENQFFDADGEFLKPMQKIISSTTKDIIGYTDSLS